MEHIVTYTVEQIQALRLMVKLQSFKRIQQVLQRNRQGLQAEHHGIAEIVGISDWVRTLDAPLLFAEHECGQQGLAAHSFSLDQKAFRLHQRLVDTQYGTDFIPGSSQSEQASVLDVVYRNQEGLRLALQTVSHELPPITQWGSRARN